MVINGQAMLPLARRLVHYKREHQGAKTIVAGAGVKHRQDTQEGPEEGEAGAEAGQLSPEPSKDNLKQPSQRKGSLASSGELEEEASAPLVGQEQVRGANAVS